MKKTLKLLWMDEKINSQENTRYQNKFKELSLETLFFNQYQDAQQFIQTNEETFDLVMILSGSLLYKLDPALKGYFICYCGNSKYHYQKFLELKQIIALIDVGFSPLQLLVKQYIQFLKSKQILLYSFCPSFVQQTHYQHSIQEISFKFLLTFAKLKQNVNITNEKKLEEMMDKDLRKIIDANQLIQLKEEVKNKNFSLLEKLMYYYSSNSIYVPLNQHFAQQNYEQIENIILVLFDGFSKLRQTQAIPKILYRGIKFDVEQHWNKITNDLLNCEQNQSNMFWNALTSVSRDENVVQNFTSHKYGIIFEIELSQENPHPYFYFNDCNSQYSYEQEILLFPQFGFQVLENTKNGTTLYCKIKQISNNFSMALNLDQREQYWNQRIEKEIKPNLEEVLKFNTIRVYSVINILCNSNEINNKSEILKEEVILCLQNLIQQFKEYYADYSQFNSLLDSFISVIKSKMNFQFQIDQTSVQPLYELINAVVQNFQDQFIKLIKRLFNFQQDNLIQNIKGYSIKDGLQKQGIYNSNNIHKQWEPKQEFNGSDQSRILLVSKTGYNTQLFNNICNTQLIFHYNYPTYVGKSILNNNIELINVSNGAFYHLEYWMGLQKALSLGKLNQIFIVEREDRVECIIYRISSILKYFHQYLNLITIIIYYYDESDDQFKNNFEYLQNKVKRKYGNMKFCTISKQDSPQNCIQKILNAFPIDIQYEVKLSESLVLEKSIELKCQQDDDEFQIHLAQYLVDLKNRLQEISKQVFSFIQEKCDVINDVLFYLRKYTFDQFSTTIVKYMNEHEKQIDDLISNFQNKNDKYLALWDILYLINREFQNNYEKIHKKILKKQLYKSNFYKDIKACPHCGLIWLKVSDCNGLSNCGEFSQIEANYVEKFLDQIYTFTREKDKISFKKSEEQFQGKYYKQPQEKQYSEPQKRVGCGKYFDWDSLPPLDQNIIAEQLFSFNIGQYQDELEQKVIAHRTNAFSIQESRQKFQDEIQGLIQVAEVEYL